MILAYALPKTGHPNCRRPDKVIDGGHATRQRAAKGALPLAKGTLPFVAIGEKGTLPFVYCDTYG